VVKNKKNKNVAKTAHSENEKPKKMFLFLLKFFAIFFVSSWLIENADLASFNSFIAGATATAAGLPFFGNSVYILQTGETFLVENLCTGLLSACILFSIIFALKKPALLKKIIIFLAGAVFLLLANIPRVLLVLLAAKNGFDAEVVHTVSWFFMSAIVVALWYYGTKKIAGIKNFEELL
jgi:exosortase/archaeosortase family protein